MLDAAPVVYYLPILNGTRNRSQGRASGVRHDPPMSMTTYRRVEREIARRAHAHEAPGNWAALGRAIGATAQRMHGWKLRGVPSNVVLLQAIADAFGWPLARLLGEEDAAPPPRSPPMVAATDSEHAALGLTPEDLRYIPADDPIVVELRERARLYRLRADIDASLGVRTATRVTGEPPPPTPTPVAKKHTKPAK